MGIHDVASKSVVNYPHHECTEFMKKIAGLCRHHESGMLNVECA
jgi:hypothetical protein